MSENLQPSEGAKDLMVYLSKQTEKPCPDPDVVESLMACFETKLQRPCWIGGLRPKEELVKLILDVSGNEGLYANNPGWKFNSTLAEKLTFFKEAILMRRKGYQLNFVPPVRLQPIGTEGQLNPYSQKYWNDFSDFVCSRAVEVAFPYDKEEASRIRRKMDLEGIFPKDVEVDERDIINTARKKMDLSGPLFISPIFRKLKSEAGPSINLVERGFGFNDETQYPVYCLVDTATKVPDGNGGERHLTPNEIYRDVNHVLEMAMNELRDAIFAVLSDENFCESIDRDITLQALFDKNIGSEQQIKRFDLMRKRVEDPKEVERFLDIMKKVCEYLGFDDVDVELLSTKEAIERKAMGLYKPAKVEGGRAKICIAMSRYGSTDLWPMKEHMHTMAHELAHHKMAKLQKEASGDQNPSHGLAHDAVCDLYFKKLKKLGIEVVANEETGKIEFSLVENGDENMFKLMKSVLLNIKEEVSSLSEKRAKIVAQVKEAAAEGVSKGLSDVVKTGLKTVTDEVTGNLEAKVSGSFPVELVKEAVAQSAPVITKAVEAGLKAEQAQRGAQIVESVGKVVGQAEDAKKLEARGALSQLVNFYFQTLKGSGTSLSGYYKVSKNDILYWLSQLQLNSSGKPFTTEVLKAVKLVNSAKTTIIGSYPKIEPRVMSAVFKTLFANI